MPSKYESVQLDFGLGQVGNCQCCCAEEAAELNRPGIPLVVLDYISTPTAAHGFQANKRGGALSRGGASKHPTRLLMRPPIFPYLFIFILLLLRRP